MQPPTPSPSLFFVFDFIRNTHRSLQSIDATAFQAGDAGARSAAQEVLSRNAFASTLVNDSSGKLALMTGGDPGQQVDFGERIREKVKGVVEI